MSSLAKPLLNWVTVRIQTVRHYHTLLLAYSNLLCLYSFTPDWLWLLPITVESDFFHAWSWGVMTFGISKLPYDVCVQLSCQFCANSPDAALTELLLQDCQSDSQQLGNIRFKCLFVFSFPDSIIMVFIILPNNSRHHALISITS